MKIESLNIHVCFKIMFYLERRQNYMPISFAFYTSNCPPRPLVIGTAYMRIITSPVPFPGRKGCDTDLCNVYLF